jgi:Mlc titration factor MtfA (ptsG expression regulator)
MKGGWEELVRTVVTRLGGVSRRRQRQRQAVLAVPFPASWTEILQTRSDHFRRLPRLIRRRFEQQTQIFLAEKRITGVKVQIDDAARLLVAASAVSLTAGWDDYTWDQLTEVLVYPLDFGRDYSFGRSEVSGIAHPWGVVILSLPALHLSFDVRSDAYHVGFHEFAHLLDLAHTRFDGIPPYLDDDSIRRWAGILETEERRLRGGDSVLDPAALSGDVELFANAVEAFFQTPVPLAARHGELYGFLSSYFAQDPASWGEGIDEDHFLSNTR